MWFLSWPWNAGPPLFTVIVPASRLRTGHGEVGAEPNELWAVTGRMRSRVQEVKMSFLLGTG